MFTSKEGGGMATEICVVQDCPCFSDIAPYISIVATDAHATINSIYRGQDPAAKRILHKYGKRTQAELYWMYVHGQGYPANPPGFSTHELYSDGVAFPSVPRGHRLPWWAQGFDVNDSDVERVIWQAASHKWKLWRPYPTGSEYHHLCFRERPRPTPRTLARIRRLRATLPRS